MDYVAYNWKVGDVFNVFSLNDLIVHIIFAEDVNNGKDQPEDNGDDVIEAFLRIYRGGMKNPGPINYFIIRHIGSHCYLSLCPSLLQVVVNVITQFKIAFNADKLSLGFRQSLDLAR